MKVDCLKKSTVQKHLSGMTQWWPISYKSLFKGRIFYALGTVYIQTFWWLIYLFKERIFYALRTVYFKSIFLPKNKTVYFQLKTAYFLSGPNIFGPRPYIFRKDRIFCQDRVFSRTVYFTFQDCIFYYLILLRSTWKLIPDHTQSYQNSLHRRLSTFCKCVLNYNESQLKNLGIFGALCSLKIQY